MAIRPVDIRRKEFKSGFRGYDANQVDDLLDEVADEFERTFAENQRLSEEITSLRSARSSSRIWRLLFGRRWYTLSRLPATSGRTRARRPS